MEVEIKDITEKSQAQLTVAVTPEELEPYLDQARKKLSSDKQLKGFRPGKAPLQVVLDVFGKERVLHEALERALPRLFMQAIIEHSIDALGQPATKVEKLSLEEGLTFQATVDVLPKVKLGDASSLQVESRVVKVTPEEVDRELNILAKSRSNYIDLARPAEQGDTVIIDFNVAMAGKTMEGGESTNHPVHLGEGHFVPGFEQKLLGIQAGETREFSLTFPDDLPNESLRGKEAQAKVKAHAVKKRSIPELNDDFAKGLGNFKNLAELKQKFEENIKTERKQREQERLQGDLAEKLAEISTVPALPESLVEREIDRRLAELQNLLSAQGKTLEDYLKEQQKDLPAVRAELTPAAKKTVEVSLVLRAFAQENNIKVEEQEIEQQTEQYLTQYVPDEKERSKIDLDQLKTSIANTLRNQKVLSVLEERASIKEVSPTNKSTKQKAI